MRLFFHLVVLSYLPFLSEAQIIHSEILEEIKSKSLATHSDAVIILKRDEIVYEDFFGKQEEPIYIASAGKSLISLAIGKLLYNGLLDSLDQPIHSLYPEWNQGSKKKVTIRMLLNHTSGIQNYPNASIEMEPPPSYQVQNVIKLALAAELSDIPGEQVSYNNKAVALLGGIIERASGMRMDEFIKKEFFDVMNIKDYDWIRDKEGNPTAHGAFIIKPSDLIKFGKIVISGGMYEGQQIVSKSWIEESLREGQSVTPIWGLLWWRLPEYEKRIIDDAVIDSWVEGNVNAEFIEIISPIKNRLFDNKFDFYKALEKLLGKDWQSKMNHYIPEPLPWNTKIFGKRTIAYYASGHRGNYLVIIPKLNIVAVRCADANGFNYETDYFGDFVSLVAKLGVSQ